VSRKRLVVDPEQLVPGGILETDRWHRDVDDGTCSRCGQVPPEEEVPLLLWAPGGRDMLRYCASCTEVQA
jgi:hypothetical protein